MGNSFNTFFLWIKKLKLIMCLVAQPCLTLCDPMDCSPSGSSVHGDSPGKNTGVGCHAFLQGIFPTQGLNPGLLYCKWILYHLSHQGSLKMIVYIIFLWTKSSKSGVYFILTAYLNSGYPQPCVG